jgi:hypothetical protein
MKNDMELKQFSTELKIRANAEIEAIREEQSDALAKTSQWIVIIEKYTLELKRFVVKYKFKGIEEEIEFFKMIKPDFAALLGYHKKVFQIQLFEAYNSAEAQLKYFRGQLKRLEAFMEKNRDFYQYILSNSDHMDETYFTRNGPHNTAVIDDRFSTPHEIRLSKILCNRMVKEYLTSAIQKIEKPTSKPTRSNLTWTGSKTDLIELIYALQAAGVFNKKDADVKQIATHFESVFNVSLGNYYRVFQEIKMRKTNSFKLIDSLRIALESKIRDADR